MINRLKAIFSGVLFIIVSTIVMQLLFILIYAGYNGIAHDYPFLQNISGVFRYILGIPIFIFIMFIGGYIAFSASSSKSIIDLVVVGVIAVLSMMLPLLIRADITTTGIIISIVMFIAVLMGGFYENKRNSFRSVNDKKLPLI